LRNHENIQKFLLPLFKAKKQKAGPPGTIQRSQAAGQAPRKYNNHQPLFCPVAA